MERTFIKSTRALDTKSRYGFSQGVKVGGAGSLIFLAGQGPVDGNAVVVGPGDIEVQTRTSFENVERALRAAGATCKDIVKMTIYCSDIDNQKQIIRKVRAEFLDSENPPPSTFIEVSKFAETGMMVEVDVIAAIG